MCVMFQRPPDFLPFAIEFQLFPYRWPEGHGLYILTSQICPRDFPFLPMPQEDRWRCHITGSFHSKQLKNQPSYLLHPHKIDRGDAVLSLLFQQLLRRHYILKLAAQDFQNFSNINLNLPWTYLPYFECFTIWRPHESAMSRVVF